MNILVQVLFIKRFLNCQNKYTRCLNRIESLIMCVHFLRRGFWRLQRKAQTTNIWSARGLIFRGITFDNIWKVFNLPIALSTWIPNLAIFFVFKISEGDKCFPLPHEHFLVKGGITNVDLHLSKRFLITNPLSAIISSPGRMLSRKPLSFVINLSETLPPHMFDTNVNAPEGNTPTSAL